MSSIQAGYQALPPDEHKLTGRGDLQTWVEDWVRVHRSVRNVAQTDVFDTAPEPARTDRDIFNQAVKVCEHFNLPLYAGRSVSIKKPEALADRLIAGLEELSVLAHTLETKSADMTQPLGQRWPPEWKMKVRLMQAYEKETRWKIGQMLASDSSLDTADEDTLQLTAACQSQLSTLLSEAATTLGSLQRAWSAHVGHLTHATPFKEVIEYIDVNRSLCEGTPLSKMYFFGNRQYYLKAISQASASATERGQLSEHAMLRFSDLDHAESVVDMACAPTSSLERWIRASLRDLAQFDHSQKVTRGSLTWASADLERMTTLPPSMPPDVRDQVSRLTATVKTIMELQERLDDLPTGRVRRMLREGTMTAMGAKSTGADMAHQSSKGTEQARPAEGSTRKITRVMSLRSREVEWSS